MQDGALGIWVVRDEAEKLGRYLETHLGGKLGGLNRKAGETNREAFSSHFADHSQWILVMAAGIAVRYLEGLLRDKSIDPGVVVIDEGCRHAIALVGGHEGGANFLAYRVANLTGAIPVVTTATEALKPLVAGIGCRRDVSIEQIDAAIEEALLAVSRSRTEIREIATADLKGDEEAIRQWCKQFGVPLRLIPCSLIQERPWVTQSSPLVYTRFGIEGVCEPCALLATFKGRLILRKITRNGVAVAIAEEVSGI
jgi:cobalt-precorrin 5A hydrolase